MRLSRAENPKNLKKFLISANLAKRLYKPIYNTSNSQSAVLTKFFLKNCLTNAIERAIMY